MWQRWQSTKAHPFLVAAYHPMNDGRRASLMGSRTSHYNPPTIPAKGPSGQAWQHKRGHVPGRQRQGGCRRRVQLHRLRRLNYRCWLCGRSQQHRPTQRPSSPVSSGDISKLEMGLFFILSPMPSRQAVFICMRVFGFVHGLER